MPFATRGFDPVSRRNNQSTLHPARVMAGRTLFALDWDRAHFVWLVTDAYNRECAITGGRVLPALEAAHIQSYSHGGEHEVSNGLLLRRDIHSVFDAGYLTFDEDLRVVVSDRVRTDFNNGNEYRRLHGQPLRPPCQPALHPNLERFKWHRENRFVG